jgi:hypothetical protein
MLTTQQIDSTGFFVFFGVRLTFLNSKPTNAFSKKCFKKLRNCKHNIKAWKRYCVWLKRWKSRATFRYKSRSVFLVLLNQCGLTLKVCRCIFIIVFVLHELFSLFFGVGKKQWTAKPMTPANMPYLIGCF